MANRLGNPVDTLDPMSDTFVLMLRGVNVGGIKLPMAEFRAMLSGLGLRGVASYIQSGNAVFRAGQADLTAQAATLPPAALAAPGAAGLEAVISAALAARFGLTVPVFLWSLAAYESVLAACPYQAEGAADGAKVHVVFHHTAPIAGAMAQPAPGLEAHATAGERFMAGQGALYLHAPAGFGTSALVAKLPRYLKGTQTARNWRTCLAVRDLARGSPVR